jgi:nitrogen fixation protein
LLAVFTTAWLFGIFSFFKEWTRDSVTKLRIKNAWELQFPYFPYEKYNKEINTIFEQFLEEDIAKKDLESYILDKLSS